VRLPGKGADLLIIDDPHSEQEAAMLQVIPKFMIRFMSGTPLGLVSGCNLAAQLSSFKLDGQSET
jgi:hypothetical protein